jgi:hypothetical protein
VTLVADSLRKSDSKEEALKVVSGLESYNISNIKSSTPIHTALTFKEQTKVKKLELREKRLAQTHHSIQHIEGCDLFFFPKITH